MSKLTLVKDADSKSSCCSGDDAPPAQDIRESGQQRYGLAVQAVVRGAKPSCCGSAATGMGGTDQSRAISTRLSKPLDFRGGPGGFVRLWHPTALAELRPVRLCSISALAAASTCCFRQGELVTARPTA